MIIHGRAYSMRVVQYSCAVQRARMRRSYLYRVRKRMHSVTVHPERRGIMPLMPNSPAEDGAGLYVSRVLGV